MPDDFIITNPDQVKEFHIIPEKFAVVLDNAIEKYGTSDLNEISHYMTEHLCDFIEGGN